MANPKSGSWHIIVVVSVTLISLCALCTSVNAGVSPDVGRAIGDATNGTFAYIGETNLKFVDTAGVQVPGGYLVSDWADSNINIPFPNSGTVFDSKKEAYRLLSGWYKVTNVTGTQQALVYFASEDDLHIATRVQGVQNFGWVTRGVNITFEATTNLDAITGTSTPSNNITYRLLDPDGFQSYAINGVSLRDINVSQDGFNQTIINTAGLDLGIYTLSVLADPNTNNGLDVKGPDVSFEVRSKGISITVEKTTETVTKDIKFNVETTPNTTVMLNVTWGAPSNVEFENEIGQEVGSSIIGTSSTDASEEGTFDRKASFSETGTYEITATELLANTIESIEVEIVQYEAKLAVDKDPSIYHIGENILSECSADVAVQMGSLTLKIDDEIVASDEPVDGFDYTWYTEYVSPGTYKIGLWVVPYSDPFSDPPDASLTVVLIRGGVFVETSTNFVALGDDFKITGTVPGRDRVDIMTIAPDGGGGSGLDPDDIFEETNNTLAASGLTYRTSGVDSGGAFEIKKIAVGETVDTGTYLVAALNYGRDGVWGNSLNDNLLKVLSNDYTTALMGKTTDQLLAILKDGTINAAGTDDLLGIATIKVEKGFVTLDELEDVSLGKDIKITGVTNRKVDTPIIITVEGLDASTPKLKPKITEVEADENNFYNKFEVSFGTASTNVGKYEVTADDGDGHVSSTTVNILPAEEPSVNVSTTPPPETGERQESEAKTVEGAKKSTTSIPTQETEETKEQPGFEVLSGIVGLLIAVAVVWQRQKEERR
jgi:hypothetical protein